MNIYVINCWSLNYNDQTLYGFVYMDVGPREATDMINGRAGPRRPSSVRSSRDVAPSLSRAMPGIRHGTWKDTAQS